jgi:hypothetical protein
MNLFILTTSISEVLAAIVGIVIFIVLMVGIPIFFSWLFKVKIVNRSGSTIAEPHHAKNIVNNISDLRRETIKKIINNVSKFNKKDSILLSSPMSDKLIKLEKLNELKMKRVINDNEFELLKSEILKS